jgi:hypothetical protein
MLHITNGAAAGGTLRRAGLGGEVSDNADILHEGPVPAGLSDERLREIRARFMAERGYCSYEHAIDYSKSWDSALEHASEHDEVVLWFEHDLFDQLNLIRVLDWFYRHPVPALSMICIDRFPGVEPFHGLGQLDAEQLASLFPFRHAVTRGELQLGTRAWRAFRSSNPDDLVALVNDDTSVLPFLGGALTRFLEEFPSVDNGLTRTERQALTVAVSTPSTVGELFRAMYPLEERIFMGDSTFYAYMRDLARGERPLVRLGPERQSELAELEALRSLTVFVTSTGEDVLEGRNDRVRLNGLDLWRGGAHLTPATLWRWNGEKLIRDASTS